MTATLTQLVVTVVAQLSFDVRSVVPVMAPLVLTYTASSVLNVEPEVDTVYEMDCDGTHKNQTECAAPVPAGTSPVSSVADTVDPVTATPAANDAVASIALSANAFQAESPQ